GGSVDPRWWGSGRGGGENAGSCSKGFKIVPSLANRRTGDLTSLLRRAKELFLGQLERSCDAAPPTWERRLHAALHRRQVRRCDAGLDGESRQTPPATPSRAAQL